ncbi:MAG: acetamidase/formamidase family protein [Planctomycetota bacterium]
MNRIYSKFKFMPFCILISAVALSGCMESKSGRSTAKPQYFLTADQTHNKFSSVIPPAIKVPSGSVIEVYTKEASDEQITANSAVEDVVNMKSDPIHPLTGPVYVEGAEPGDILAVKIHKIELGEYGWQAIVPGFGFLADEFSEAKLKIFKLGANKKSVNFTDKISIQLKPFAGVMGVAPKTEEMLVTGPPRANGGNMDDPSLVEGTTVYFPVFVKGALFSVGDAHAVQGYGEVCGTAIEAPVRIVYEVNVIKGRKIAEPQYETDDYYAVTGFGRTIDEAAKKATGYMIDYLAAEHGLSREDAYMLCSLAGDLKIAEVVDIPHMLVTMHISKDVLGM